MPYVTAEVFLLHFISYGFLHARIFILAWNIMLQCITTVYSGMTKNTLRTVMVIVFQNNVWVCLEQGEYRSR